MRIDEQVKDVKARIESIKELLSDLLKRKDELVKTGQAVSKEIADEIEKLVAELKEHKDEIESLVKDIVGQFSAWGKKTAETVKDHTDGEKHHDCDCDCHKDKKEDK